MMPKPGTPLASVYNQLAQEVEEHIWRIVWLEGIAMSYGALTLSILAKGIADDGLLWFALLLAVVSLPMYFFGFRQLIRWMRHTLPRKNV